MTRQLQPRGIDRGNESVEIPLRFALKLRLHLDMKRLSVAQAAEKSGVTKERMEDILSGAHKVEAPDLLRVMYGLGIYFEPEDFLERGLDL